MSQQLQEQLKEQMKFKLQVRYDTKPTHHIPHARLVAKDLSIKVKDEAGIMFETHKKAWLIDQIELTENKIQSTILQQSTIGAWIAFETIHDKDVELEEIFVEISKASKNLKLMTYPLWFIIGILVIIEGLLIKKTLFDKEVIMLAKHDWINIILISLSVMLLFILFFYYILKQVMNEGYFRINGHEYVSIETVEFYIELKSPLGLKRTAKYQITLQTYRGKYYHPDRADQLSFAKDREPLSTIKHIRQKLKMARDAILTLREREYELDGDIDTLQQEERDLELLAIKKSITNIESQISEKKLTSPIIIETKNDKDPKKTTIEEEQITRDIIKELIENDEELKELRNQIKIKLDEKEQVKNQIELKKTEYQGLLGDLRSQFSEALGSSFKFDPEKDKDEQIDEILDSHNRAVYYKSKAADLRNTILHLRQNMGGLYHVNSQMSESFEHRLAVASAQVANTDYDYQIIAGSEEEVALAEKTGSETIARNKQARGIPFDRVINIFIVMGAIAGFLAAMYFISVSLFDKFSEKPFIAIFILILLIIFALFAVKFGNWLANYTTHTQSSVRLRD